MFSAQGLLQLKCSIDGFALFLIGDLHEQPLLHFAVKPFILGAQDWSGEVSKLTFQSVEDFEPAWDSYAPLRLLRPMSITGI